MTKRNKFRFTQIEVVGFDDKGNAITREKSMNGDEYVKWMVEQWRRLMAAPKEEKHG